MSQDTPQAINVDGEAISVGIVAARFNEKYVNVLVERTVETLKAAGVTDDNIDIYRVPGSNEIPFAASMLIQTGTVDVLIGLGLIIAGDTPHHEIIAHGTERALQSISIAGDVPVINGIITVMNEEQAKERILGSMDRGQEFGRAALEMAVLAGELVQKNDIFGDDAFFDALDAADDDDLDR